MISQQSESQKARKKRQEEIKQQFQAKIITRRAVVKN